MKSSKRFTVAGIAIACVAVLLALSLGCAPPPAPLPPPQPAPAPAPQPVARPTTEEWVSLPVRILYPTGGARLDDQARAMCREGHASLAHRTDIVRVRVEGHADGRGSEAANHQLGLERAQGVVDFLVGDLGMPRELFEIVSYGDDHPITSDTTTADQVQNRRVEFSILVRRQAAY
jgi:outer membrane protein OmpA-like peptidoglycan-associated protein